MRPVRGTPARHSWLDDASFKIPADTDMGAYEQIVVKAKVPAARLLTCGDAQVMPKFLSSPWEPGMHLMECHVISAHNDTNRVAPVFSREGGKEVRHLRRHGTLTLCPAGDERWSRAEGSITYSVAMITERRLDQCAEDLGVARHVELVHRSCVDDPVTFGLVSCLVEEAQLEGPLPRAFFDQAIDLICLQMLRAHSFVTPRKTRELSGLAGWQVKRVTDYMEDHLGRDLGLQELAGVVGLSRFHFCSAFKRATGFTPFVWLLRLRMREAKRLLSDFTLSVADVASVLGYTSPSAFTQAFRRVVGQSPAQYRSAL